MRPAILSPKAVRTAQKHLSKSDKIMAQLVSAHGPCQLAEREFRPFQTLVTSIISQQLSAKAADTIERRVMMLVPTFTPYGFLGTSIDALRSVGLSSSKASYILELATHVVTEKLDFDILLHQPDEDIITALTELSGIGRWTAEMFLIFGLRRPDVLALRDAGLRRSVKLLYGTTELEQVGEAWRPYCSVASWYLWRHLDSD
jgi:DNA-3-methyladenine glycosylase II